MKTVIIASAGSGISVSGQFDRMEITMNKIEKLRELLKKGNNPPVEDMILFAFYLGKLSAAREIQKKYEEGINDIINTCKGDHL